jgi:hypothetical protein
LPASALRSARLIRVLQQVGSAEAKDFLDELAGGRYGIEYVEDAKAAMKTLR